MVGAKSRANLVMENDFDKQRKNRGSWGKIWVW